MPVSNAAKSLARYPATTARALLALVAIAWGTFAFLGAPDPEPTFIGYFYATLLTALLAALAIGAWIRGRLTGALAVAGGMAAAIFFDHPAPQFAMGVPLALSGVLLLWQRERRKPADPFGDDTPMAVASASGPDPDDDLD